MSMSDRSVMNFCIRRNTMKATFISPIIEIIECDPQDILTIISGERAGIEQLYRWADLAKYSMDNNG